MSGEQASSYTTYLDGLQQLTRETRAARETGEEWAPGWSAAYARAMVERERFLEAMDGLAHAPGHTPEEVREATAGILELSRRIKTQTRDGEVTQ